MKRTLLVVVLVVAACSDGGDDEKAAVRTTTTATTGTTTTTADVDACFAFEEVDRGASVTVLSVSDCEGNALLIDGQPAAFPVGGTVTHAEGMRCEGDGLVVLSAVSDDGETFQATETTYEVRDGELVRSEATGRTLTAEEAQPYYELDCPTS
jgi:hypothetical protein